MDWFDACRRILLAFRRGESEFSWATRILGTVIVLAILVALAWARVS